MLFLYITLFTVLLAAVIDARYRRIPNLITLPAILLGAILNFYHSGLAGLGGALLGTVVGILLLLIPFAFGGMGAGDVKLLAAIGALNGYGFVVEAFFYTAVAGGVMAIILALYHGKLSSVIFNSFLAVQSISTDKGKNGKAGILAFNSNIRFPYGIAILAGTVLAFYMR